MCEAIERILQLPSPRLGRWPTPICAVRSNGSRILVKRDDLSGYGRGGVKTRKIEQVVGHVLRHGYDSFITPVGNVTNLAHDIVPVLDGYGIDWEIVVADTPRLPLGERQRIFGDLGERVRLVGPGYAAAARALSDAVRRSRGAGHRPFVAPPSLAHPAAVIATARGYLEMVWQADTMGMAPVRTVFITAASGTALAGFVLAEHLRRRDGQPPIRVVGVQVYPGPARRWIHGLIRWTERRLSVTPHVRNRDIELRTDALHGGFGHYPTELVDLCRRVADETGLRIDPVFGAKTWTVMESYLASAAPSGSVLYWHCGYTPDWNTLAGA